MAAAFLFEISFWNIPHIYIINIRSVVRVCKDNAVVGIPAADIGMLGIGGLTVVEIVVLGSRLYYAQGIRSFCRDYGAIQRL